jgi:hypothetical protein
MEGGQSCPTACRDLNVVPSTVTTIMKMLIKLKIKWKLQEGNLLQLLDTRDPMTGKMEQSTLIIHSQGIPLVSNT